MSRREQSGEEQSRAVQSRAKHKKGNNPPPRRRRHAPLRAHHRTHIGTVAATAVVDKNVSPGEGSKGAGSGGADGIIARGRVARGLLLLLLLLRHPDLHHLISPQEHAHSGVDDGEREDEDDRDGDAGNLDTALPSRVVNLPLASDRAPPPLAPKLWSRYLSTKSGTALV